MPTLSDNYATVLLDFPDSPEEKVSFVLLETFVSGKSVFDSGETYRITLDDEGVGEIRLPVPDGNGEFAAYYRAVLPNGKRDDFALFWDEDPQDFFDLARISLTELPAIQSLGTIGSIPADPLTLVRRGLIGEVNGYFVHPKTVPVGTVVRVPGDMQMITGGDFVVLGDLVVSGGFTNVS
jgi:hypothetical protein